LPAEEQINLGQQIRRSAISIASNVAEGYARRTARGYAHYIMVAYGALLELDTQFDIARGAGYLVNEDLTDVMPLIERVAVSLAEIVRVLGPEAASE
jgi:four helix bundle protein